MLSFGADPSVAENVTWHVDRRPIDELGSSIRPALHQLQSSRQGTPSAAAIMWIGNEASKIRLPFSASTKMGTDGVLHTDLAAFHTARVQWAATGDGAPLTGNRVHCSGRNRPPSPNEWRSEAKSRTPALVGAAGRRQHGRGTPRGLPRIPRADLGRLPGSAAPGRQTASSATSGSPRTGTWSASTTSGSIGRPNGTGRVGDMTLAELQEFDFGGQHPSRELGDAPGRHRDTDPG